MHGLSDINYNINILSFYLLFIIVPILVECNNSCYKQIITSNDYESSDWFGAGVSISNNYAIVGAYGDDDAGSESGSAYIYMNLT